MTTIHAGRLKVRFDLSSLQARKSAFGPFETLKTSMLIVGSWRYLCIPAVGSDSKIPPFRDGEDGAF